VEAEDLLAAEEGEGEEEDEDDDDDLGDEFEEEDEDDLEDEGWRPARLEPVRVAPVPGRNEPCPCGSGRKYKKCCGA
jgi:uncharacterized protein